MVSGSDMMERFAKLEKVDIPDREGFKPVKNISEVTDESIIIPFSSTSYYELFDLFEEKVKEFRIFNDKEKKFWLVEVTEND